MGVGCTVSRAGLLIGRGHPQRRYAGAAFGKHSEGGRKGFIERVNVGRSLSFGLFEITFA